MAEKLILSSNCQVGLSLVLIISCLLGLSHSINELVPSNTYTVSSYRYPETQVKPYDSRYIRVDLPQWFSSISISVESDVDLDDKGISKVSTSTLPIFCFRDGSPPLPDFLNSSQISSGSISNISFEEFQGPQSVECYPMQKNVTLRLTNEQIYPGVWYLGLFNGIGPTRTQSKMIIRSPAYSFTANISVEGCMTSAIWGQSCNQTLYPLSCSPSASYNLSQYISGSNIQPIGGNAFSCITTSSSCQGEGESQVYLLEMLRITEEMTIVVVNVSSNATTSNNVVNAGDANLKLLVRHGAMPSASSYDYSHDINKSPLVIHTPKIGRWFLTVLPSSEHGGIGNPNVQVCYTIHLQLFECPEGKAGENCTSERVLLQTVLRRGSTPFESYFLPIGQGMPADSANFPVESISAKSLYGGAPNDSWTYFLLNIPSGAAGGNIHIQLTSVANINYEVYVRFGGLPSVDSWDYYYANTTRNSDGSMFFRLYNSTGEKVDFYLLYVKEGTWSFGLRHINTTNSASNDQTIMSVSVERCPKRCSSRGECKTALDASGLTSYSFCSCDRTHGGFDCSVEIVSHQGHLWQSIALIGSNAAAILPAFWSLRKKAFAEWILFTASGISSGLYHACDVGTWCALSFGVLQFMDFWLSFMAVVSTFVYLTTVDEAFKRTIHTAVAILTALMAITKATRSSNIILVIAIGTLGLIIGWVIEFSTKFRSLSFSRELCLNMTTRWQTIRGWGKDLMKTLKRKFRWGFILAGFTALAMAAISWNLESTESYWIWHSIWHVSIYTSSFLFLCSKVDNVRIEDHRPLDARYALTRQDSLSRA